MKQAAVFTFLFACLFAACAAARDAPPPTNGAQAAGFPPPFIEGSGGQKPAVSTEIRNAVMAVKVEDFGKAETQVRDFAGKKKGFVLRAEKRRNDSGGYSGTMVVKVPVEGYAEALEFFGGLGTVFEQNETTEDVADNLADLAARLKSARALEARILELLNRPESKMADLLETERELARVRESIEQLEGKNVDLSRRTSFGVFTLNMFVTATVDMEARTWYGPFVHQLRDAGRTIAVSFGALLTVILFLLPWAALLWGVYRLWRKHRDRKALPQPTPPTPLRPNAPPAGNSDGKGEE